MNATASRARSVGTALTGATTGGSSRRMPTVLLPVLVLVVATAAGIGAVGGLGRYQVSLLTTLLLYVAIAQAWNILAGFGGEISLGVGAFVGAGAYATGLLMLHRGLGWLPALGLGTLAGAVLAAVLAVPLLRLRGDYFAIGTLAAGLALQAWLVNWHYAGGSTGITIPIMKTPEAPTLYRIAVVTAAIAVLAALLVKHSRFGLRLMAVRDDAGAAAGLGVSAFRHRFAALVLSSALTALAGGVVALQQIGYEPNGMLGINWTINALLMVIVGGLGTIFGPVVGAVIVYYLLTNQLADEQTLGLIIEGVLLVLIVRFAPQGLWPWAARLLSWLWHRLRPGTT